MSKSPRRIRYASKTLADKYYDRLVNGLAPKCKEGGVFSVFIDEFFRELQKRGLETISYIIDDPQMRSAVNDRSCFQISIEDSILTAQVYSEEYEYFCLYNSDADSTFLMNSIDYNLRQRLFPAQQESDFFSVLWLRQLQMVQPTSVNHFEIIRQKLVSLKPTKFANENLKHLINDAKTYIRILISANQYSPTITVDFLTSIHDNCSQTGTFQHDLLSKLSQIKDEAIKLLTLSHASSFKILQSKGLDPITVLERLPFKYYTIRNSNLWKPDMVKQNLSRVPASISLASGETIRLPADIIEQRIVLPKLLKISDKPSDQPPDKPDNSSEKPFVPTKKKPWRRIPPKDDESESEKHKGTWFYWCKTCSLWRKPYGTAEHGNNKKNLVSDTEKGVNLMLDPSIWHLSPSVVATMQGLTVKTPHHDALLSSQQQTSSCICFGHCWRLFSRILSF